MEKVNYSIEEIIMGLRSEYQHYQNELAKLKNHVVTEDKRVLDYTFLLLQEKVTENPSLYLDYTLKRSKLEKLLKEKLYKLNFDRLDSFKDGTGKVLRNANGKFTISGLYNVWIQNNRSFAKKFQEIIDSDFAKYMPFFLGNLGLDINYNGIDIGLQSDIYKVKGSLGYYARDDYLEISQFFNEPMTLPEALSIEVPRRYLTPYHTSCIDGYLENKKPVVIVDDASVPGVYKIMDDEDAIVLKRTK